MVPGEPFLADSSGWFFTDAQVEDLASDTERLVLLERQVDLWKDLVALKDQKIEVLTEELDDAEPTFWESIPSFVWILSGMLLVEVLR